MLTEIKEGIKKSKKILELNWNEIYKTWFSNFDKKIISVDGLFNNDVATKIDKCASIDFFLKDNYGLMGVSFRSHQYKCDNLLTLTLRKDRTSGYLTEYEKIKKSINRNGVVSKYYIELYFLENTNYKYHKIFLWKTKDMIDYIDNGKEGIDWNVRSSYTFGKKDGTFFSAHHKIYQKKKDLFIMSNENKNIIVDKQQISNYELSTF